VASSNANFELFADPPDLMNGAFLAVRGVAALSRVLTCCKGSVLC
jgi:hypothetical protein